MTAQRDTLASVCTDLRADNARDRAERDVWVARYQTAARKRRHTALHARDLQRRLNGEHALVDGYQVKLDAKRREIAELQTNLAKARAVPTYMDGEGRQSPDTIARTVNHANAWRDKLAQAEQANRALQQRCERAEAAVTVGADAIEAMGTRLAIAESAVRQMRAAA